MVKGRRLGVVRGEQEEGPNPPAPFPEREGGGREFEIMIRHFPFYSPLRFGEGMGEGSVERWI
jgi:hypothetical protein